MVREYGGSAALMAAEAREGTWGAASRHNHLVIEWPGDNTALRAGDRYVISFSDTMNFGLSVKQKQNIRQRIWFKDKFLSVTKHNSKTR